MAQPTLKVDKSDVLIGDEIQLILEVPYADRWVNQEIDPFDTVAVIQQLGDPVLEVVNGAATKRWIIAAYDTGYVRIPPVAVALRGGDTMYTNDIPLVVHGVVDSAGLVPIKPIIYEPVQFSDYLPYILGFVGALLLAGLAYWWSKRPKRVVEEEEVIEVVPAHDLALQQLRELEAKQMWQQGHVAEYHSALSHILREYLEARYDVAALESTTSEVSHLLKPILTEEQFDEMMRMMRLEDLIKFAKAEPPENVHAEHLEFTRQFILNTKQEINTEIENV